MIALFVCSWFIAGFVAARMVFSHPLEGGFSEWLTCLAFFGLGGVSMSIIALLMAAKIIFKTIEWLWAHAEGLYAFNVKFWQW